MTSAAPVNPFLHLQRNADDNPNGVFLRSPTTVLTNAEAVVEVKKLAYELRRLGVRAGHVVALDLPDQLSILFTEAVFHEAAISTVLPEAYVANFAVHWVFTNRSTAPQTGATVIPVDSAFLQRVDQNPYGIRPSEEPIETLRIVYSSGTTGTPRAIALGRAMEAVMDATLDMTVQSSPVICMMDTGTAWGLGELYLSVKAAVPFLSVGGANPEAIARLASETSARTFKGSPAQVAALVDVLEANGQTLPGIQTVIVAGTVMPPGVAERMRRATDGCRIFGNYGSTEAGGASARLYEAEDPFDAGHIIPGSVVEIVDEDDQPLPQGEVGRIRHRSPGMVDGYIGDPEATARSFRGGWFYPGDLGFFRADTGLTLTGRESEVLNAGGVKIDPTRLDLFALQMNGVTDAASFAYDTASGLQQIGIALVTDDAVDPQSLVDALGREFGAAAPKLVARVDSVPRNAMGKPMRRTLAAKYRES